MAQSEEDALPKIHGFAKEMRGLRSESMEIDASNTEARLDQTLKALRAQVQKQQAALDELLSASRTGLEMIVHASEDPRQKLQQLHAVTAAYKNLKPKPTFLPDHDSLLPTLLATHTVRQNVQDTREAIQSTEARLQVVETSLRREKSFLLDADALSKAMESRLKRLQTQHKDHSQKSPAQLVKDLITAKRESKAHFDREMARVGDAINGFIDEYLSPMVAVEELGGPVVGDMLEVQDATLAAGFTKQGRAKSTKKPVSDKLRQRRIEEIWDARVEVEGEDAPPTEAEAADADMRRLLEALFATLMGPGGGKAYHRLERDSAASRFLVRAKIAQFHPKDAGKIRLIDFGRELDD